MNQIGVPPIDFHQSQQPVAGELSPEQVNRQLELILNSRHLRQARSLEKFLRYVVAKSLAGEEGDLKEYTIGVDVFQRGAEYDPRKDAVVRVQANVLRKRIASYYEDEGLLDELIIEIPKGHYVPQFYRRALKTDLTVVPQVIAGSDGAGAGESLIIPESDHRFRWRTPIWVAMTFVLGLATAMGWQSWLGKRVMAGSGAGQFAVTGQASNKSAVDPAYLPLWEQFLEPGAENILAYGTPQFFVSSGLYLRDVEVNSPQGSDAAARLKMLQRAMHGPFRPTEVYTGVGETHGVYLLTKFFGKLNGELRVTRSRMVGWNELKNANVIFLSSMRFHTLAKELPYPSDFVIHPGISSKIVNLHPRAGEPETYGGGDDIVYAFVTVWPGKLHQRRILVLSGSTTWATLAAAEYVTDPEYLRQLNPHLEQCRKQSGHAQHAPFFQVLLRAEVKDNQPINISYVTHHDFEIEDSNAPGLLTAGAGSVAQLSAAQR
jgi:hypothetical protein